MNPYFSLILIVFTCIQIAIGFFYNNAALYFFQLYRTKYHPVYPLTGLDRMKLLQEQGLKGLLTLFTTPFFMLKIILSRHGDTKLAYAARKVWLLVLLFLATFVVEWFLIFATTPNLHFRLG